VLQECAEDAVQDRTRAGRTRINVTLRGLLLRVLIDRTHQLSEDVAHAARLLLRLLRPAAHQTAEQIAQTATLLLWLSAAQHATEHSAEATALLLASAECRAEHAPKHSALLTAEHRSKNAADAALLLMSATHQCAEHATDTAATKQTARDGERIQAAALIAGQHPQDWPERRHRSGRTCATGVVLSKTLRDRPDDRPEVRGRKLVRTALEGLCGLLEATRVRLRGETISLPTDGPSDLRENLAQVGARIARGGILCDLKFGEHVRTMGWAVRIGGIQLSLLGLQLSDHTAEQIVECHGYS
jgi:hypothetical protein